MHERTVYSRIETAHDPVYTSEGSETHATAEVFPERRHVRQDAMLLLQPAGRQPRRHHLVEDQHEAVPLRLLAQQGEELAVRRDAATGSDHGLDKHRRQLMAVPRK